MTADGLSAVVPVGGFLSPVIEPSLGGRAARVAIGGRQDAVGGFVVHRRASSRDKSLPEYVRPLPGVMPIMAETRSVADRHAAPAGARLPGCPVTGAALNAGIQLSRGAGRSAGGLAVSRWSWRGRRLPSAEAAAGSRRRRP